MSRGVCPGLERTPTGYLCTYSQKQVNPYAWYCLGDYYECPIYIQYMKTRGVQAKPETKPTQTVQSLQQVQAQTTQARAVVTTVKVETPPAVDTEDELIRNSENILGKFEGSAKALDNKWRDYENSVQSTKQSWEVDKMRLMRYISILTRISEKYSEDLKEIEIRRSMGLINEDTYNKLRESVQKKLDKINNKLKELNTRYQEIDNQINQHYRRLLMTTVTPETSKLKLSLAKLEEMYREGRISKEVYEKLKAEIQGVIGQ
ncbi:hypothetical protein [Vulcanisaeta thermophila]|uniref:hypothetical protein n=1 Tax=Vulcanisaeta thermophila TaxID=867917 RepID=UPI0008532BFC|nr:hypothetical protein [Vulcanisaeta thermophila]